APPMSGVSTRTRSGGSATAPPSSSGTRTFRPSRSCSTRLGVRRTSRPTCAERRLVASLRETQRAFRGALLDGAAEHADLGIVEDGLSGGARLTIFLHPVPASLTAVLESAYPVVCRLVDRRFFAYAADTFIRRHPPA